MIHPLNISRPRTPLRFVLGLAALLLGATAGAQVVIQENMTGTSANLNWAAAGGACLTAGDSTNTGTIPSCVGLPYYGTQIQVGGNSGYLGNSTAPASASAQLPDPSGYGALRLTNGYPNYSQAGAVISNFTFPSDSGVAVTFKTVTYRGDSGGTGKDGADGISFFLMDGSVAPNIGSWGGSLGYTCSNSNTPYTGLVGAYLGLGIDEYGNFLNASDNTNAGYGYQPGRIGLRGYGNIAWSWLNANYPTWYPGTLTASQQAAAVQNTCKSGYLYNYSNANSPVKTTTAVADYAPIPNAYKVLTGVTIANESATKRSQAIPIVYNLKITNDGLLSLAYSYNGGPSQPVLTNQSIKAANGPLPSTLRFGFAGSTGGSDNIHEIICFKATPADQSDSSASVNLPLDKLIAGAQVYLPTYHTNNWWGQLTAQYLLYNATTNTLSASPTINWDASCVLTGGNCASTGAVGMTAESPTARTILTWSGTAGVPFEWNNLSTAQQNALDAGDASPSANRMNYLRGDRSNEVNTAGVGLYRLRSSVLGDVIHSSPYWVGPPVDGYGASWTDKLYPAQTPSENATGAQTYPVFSAAMATRQNVVYTGANDGMLHGFRSGAFDSSGNFVSNSTYPNDGYEVLAYVPNAIINTIHPVTVTASMPVPADLDYSNTQYVHAFDVDAPPRAEDLFYTGSWHTWLVGGLGAGGSAIYALDVTNPSRFSESNAASLVIGEWTPSTITCANVASCGNYLGNTYGTPVIWRFHNGMWGVVFGNGFNSANGTAGIFIMLVNPATGAQTFYYLDTGYGTANDPTGQARANGIAYTSPVDLDGDNTVDYVYAGDFFGNVWRFDVTSSNPSSWFVTTYGNSTPTPLFSTPTATVSGAVVGQPITSKLVVVTTTLTTGMSGVMVNFGTGQEIPQTVTAPTSYAAGPQALYGIWDWYMSDWNSKAHMALASLSGTHPIAVSSLVAQSITQVNTTAVTGTSILGEEAISSYPVCWYGSSVCSSNNNQFGWTLPLTNSGEQVIYNPSVWQGILQVNTTIPNSSSTSIYSCSVTPPTGWTIFISPSSGGAFPTSPFVNGSGSPLTMVGSNGANVTVSGVSVNGTGSITNVSASGQYFWLTDTSNGTPAIGGERAVAAVSGHRVTWTELR